MKNILIAAVVTVLAFTSCTKNGPEKISPVSKSLEGIYGPLDISNDNNLLIFLSGGRVTSSLPKEGLDGLDAEASSQQNPGVWGTYSYYGNTVSIHWNAGGEGTATVQNDLSLQYNGESLHHFSNCNGRVLDGKYELAQQTDASFNFHSDGTYTASGLLVQLGVTGSYSNSGIYNIQNYTLHLIPNRGAEVKCVYLEQGTEHSMTPALIWLNAIALEVVE